MPGVCSRCNRNVFKADEKIALGRVWHNFCFSCYKCRKLLEACKVYTQNGELWCQVCYARSQGQCPCHLDVPKNYIIERDYDTLKDIHHRQLCGEDVEVDCTAAEYCISQMDINSRRTCFQCDTTEYRPANGDCGVQKDMKPTYHHSSAYSSEDSDVQYDGVKGSCGTGTEGTGRNSLKTRNSRASILKTSANQRSCQMSSDGGSEVAESQCQSNRSPTRCRSESPISSKSSCCCCKSCVFGNKGLEEECQCPDPNVPPGVCSLPSPTAITAWYSRQHKIKRVRHRCCDNVVVEYDQSEEPYRVSCSADRGYLSNDACADCCSGPVKEDNTGGCINDKGSRGITQSKTCGSEQDFRDRVMPDSEDKNSGCRQDNRDSRYTNSGGGGGGCSERRMPDGGQDVRNRGRSDSNYDMPQCGRDSGMYKSSGGPCSKERRTLEGIENTKNREMCEGNEQLNDCGGMTSGRQNSKDNKMARSSQGNRGCGGNESSENLRDRGIPSCGQNNMDRRMSRNSQDNRGCGGSESGEYLRDNGAPSCGQNNMPRNIQDNRGCGGNESSEELRDRGMPSCGQNNTDSRMSRNSQDNRGRRGNESNDEMRDRGLPNCGQNNTDSRMSRNDQDNRYCGTNVSNDDMSNSQNNRTYSKKRDRQDDRGSENYPNRGCQTNRGDRGCGSGPKKNDYSESRDTYQDGDSKGKGCYSQDNRKNKGCGATPDKSAGKSSGGCQFSSKDNRQLMADSSDGNNCGCPDDSKGQKGNKMYSGCEIRGSRIDGGCCGLSLGGGTVCRRCGRQEGVPCGDDAGLWGRLPYILLLLLLLPKTSGGQQYLGESRRNIL